MTPPPPGTAPDTGQASPPVGVRPVKVLVVEDEPHVRRTLLIVLRTHGFAVEAVATAADAEQAVRERPPDVVLLDLGLPDRDGISVVRSLRRWSQVPVVVVSGRPGSKDKVAALDAGADDYVLKPFDVDELAARVRAAHRRAPARPAPPRMRLGEVEIDLALRTVTRVGDAGTAGELVHLTPTEWLVVGELLRHPGRLVTHRRLITVVWGAHAYPAQIDALRVYMVRIRRKLEPDPGRPRGLLTEPGIGYRFCPEPGTAEPETSPSTAPGPGTGGP